MPERTVGDEIGERDAGHRDGGDRCGEESRAREEPKPRPPRPRGECGALESWCSFRLGEQGQGPHGSRESRPARRSGEKCAPRKPDREERGHHIERYEGPVLGCEGEDTDSDRSGPRARNGPEKPPAGEEDRRERPPSRQKPEAKVGRHARVEEPERAGDGVRRKRPVVVPHVLPESLSRGQSHRDGPLSAEVTLKGGPAKPREARQEGEKADREDEISPAGDR